MDVYKTTMSIHKWTKTVVMLMVLFNVAGLVFAQQAGEAPGGQNIKNAMKELCTTAQFLLAGAALVLIVLAAVVYAIGQITGAETRARASVWATAMIVGALVGLAIYLIVPTIIRTLLGVPAADNQNPCDFENIQPVIGGGAPA